MTYSSPYSGASQGRGGSSNSPYDAYGQHPVNAPYAGAPYGQPPPAGRAPYAHPGQLAFPPQSMYPTPGGPAFPEQPSPSPQVPALQYFADPVGTSQYQPYATSGSPYLSGAATAPGYSSEGRLARPGHPSAETATSRANGTGHHVPWRGEKTAALIMMVLAATIEAVSFITLLLSLAGGSDWLVFLLITMMLVGVTPVIWSFYFGLRHLFRNQPVCEMVGLALWFGYGVLGLLSGTSNNDPQAGLYAVCTVLSFIVTSIAAVLTVQLNQRLKDPQPWTVTLALGACQFVLLNNILRLGEFGVITYTTVSNGESLSEYTASTWLMWSNSGGVGLPLAPGLIISVAITSLAAIGVVLGMRSPRSRGFRIASVTAVSLLTLCNLIIVLAYGLPTSGGHAHKPSDMGLEVVTIIIVGAILIGATLLAGHRSLASPPVNGNQYGPRASGAPSTQGMQSRFRQYGRPQWPTGGGY